MSNPLTVGRITQLTDIPLRPREPITIVSTCDKCGYAHMRGTECITPLDMVELERLGEQLLENEARKIYDEIRGDIKHWPSFLLGYKAGRGRAPR